jgi:hypothetical protein
MTIITVISQQPLTTEQVNSYVSVPTGGSSGQVLAKNSGTSFDMVWVNQVVATDKHYEFTQNTATSVWNITHNLNTYPSITVVDSAGNEVEGSVQFTSSNTITITFSAGFAGKAYLN